MDVTTLFLQTDDRKLRQEFKQLVAILTGRAPTSMSEANVFLQEKCIHEARKLGKEQRNSITSQAPALLSYFQQLGLLEERMIVSGSGTVLLLGAKVTAILKRVELLLRCVRAGLRPDGPVHLLTSVRPLEHDELEIVRSFPQCPVAPGLELTSPLPGSEPATEADLIEAIYKMVFEKVSVLHQANYHISIHPSPKAGTVDCARRWAGTAQRDVANVIAVSGPQPWGVYQALSTARGLRACGIHCPVEYVAYVPSAQPDALAASEAFAKTVYEMTQQ